MAIHIVKMFEHFHIHFTNLMRTLLHQHGASPINVFKTLKNSDVAQTANLTSLVSFVLTALFAVAAQNDKDVLMVVSGNDTSEFLQATDMLKTYYL